MRKWFLGLAASLTVLSSCSEDIDLTAPYKDITIAYGLIDELKDTNWIRIQKGYLGDDNAVLYAAIPDSLYYPASLVVWVKEYNSVGAQTDSVLLERMVNPVVKDPGTFSSDSNVLYRMVKNTDAAFTYKLFIKKPNGDTTTSETILANSITMNTPPAAFDWEPDNILVQDQVVRFRWVHDPNSYAYQTGIKFKYEEWDVSNPGVVENKSFTHIFPMFRPTSDYQCFTNQICYDVHKLDFYSMIVNNIDVDINKARRFISFDFIVLQATEELYNYITINAPSLSYVQKVTDYTNIAGGHGIFASRTSGGYVDRILNDQTRDSLESGQYTWQLNFQP